MRFWDAIEGSGKSNQCIPGFTGQHRAFWDGIVGLWDGGTVG